METQNELTTKQEDLSLDNDSDEFLDYEELAEKQADYGDYMYEVMRDMEIERQYEELQNNDSEDKQ